MKRNILLFLILAVLTTACKNEPKNESTAQNTPKVDTIKMPEPLTKEGATTYVVTEGQVNWSGKKATGSSHFGNFKVKSGELLVKEGRLLGGKIEIDMTSVTVLDLKDPNEKADLESHLKDADFFEVGKYPVATFEFDEVLPSNDPTFNTVIPGTLTMKGKKGEVNVPLKMTINGSDLSAESTSFVINRTKWGVNFHSGTLGTLKDKIIEDTVPLSLTLKAKVKN